MLPSKSDVSGSVAVNGAAKLKELMQKRQGRNEAVPKEPKTQPFQGVFTFDVTGSMFGYFDACRENIANITSQIHKQNPVSQFSIGYFRNRGDEDAFGLTKFHSDEKSIAQEIGNIKKGGGSPDWRCCVQRCLHAANSLTWQEESAKALVCIVDQYPNGVHGATSACSHKIDWSYEIDNLQEKGVRVYPVFVGDDEEIKGFYEQIAQRTDGRLLPISDMHLITDMLVAIAIKETGGSVREYIQRLEKMGKLSIAHKQTLLLLE
ncbi:MAG: vWA domain-containing protein [Parcubacteria group bacterium]|jgi:hypothetical protein